MLILVPLYILAIIATFVMFPSALATWWSRCFKISLAYGFGIVFTALIVELVVQNLKDDGPIHEDGTRGWPVHTPLSEAIESMYIFAISCAIIYGVYIQFNGGCNLGYKKSKR